MPTNASVNLAPKATQNPSKDKRNKQRSSVAHAGGPHEVDTDDAVENNKLSDAKGSKASSSVASSKSNRSHSPVSKEDVKCPRVVEDINYACMGKFFEDGVDSFENTEERFIGEPELLGCKPNVEMPHVVDGGNISNGNCNWLYQGQGKNIINDNILDDLKSLGYNKMDLAHLKSPNIDTDLDISGDQLKARPVGFESWEECVDKLNNNILDPLFMVDKSVNRV
ncbi:hypothetical protein V6N11_052725 [Hibiscus sabdariffa]|uniref:Uncharacterized protein n=1 Tax=Hibiscus sabdariffa TaxID=183260 RepID=A0ABR2UBL2_9ROSI